MHPAELELDRDGVAVRPGVIAACCERREGSLHRGVVAYEQSAHQGITDCEERLQTTQDLLLESGRGRFGGGPRPTLVRGQQQARQRPLDEACWLNRGRPLDDPHEVCWPNTSTRLRAMADSLVLCCNRGSQI